MRFSIAHLALVALANLAGCAAGVQLARNGLQEPGALLFNGYARETVNCFVCHNGDGLGSGRGPSLAGPVAKLNDAALLEIINKGEGFMPAFRDRMSDDEKREVIVWLRGRFGGGAPSVPSIELDDTDIEEEPAPAH